MKRIKSYTDLEQSKKLAEILPLESADMRYHTVSHYNPYPCDEIIYTVDFDRASGIDIPCWSLAALFNAVDFSTINLHYDNARKDWVASATIHNSTKYCTKYESTRALNLVDACVEMIIKLHEQNLL